MLLPSDHHIADNINYLNTINKALHYVNEFGICTIGIPINVISAEYGYINTGLSIAENVYLVDHFIEKPILEQAKKHFQSNEYFWNSGIFVYDINFFLNLAMNLQPDLFCIAEKAFNTAVKNENSLAIDDEAYNEIEAISIDNAIMEYISGMVMIKADFAWNDLGTWHSLLQVKHRNINDNYCEGNVVTSNTTNSFISSNNKLTTVVGLDNVIIIDTMNGLLVTDKSKMNDLEKAKILFTALFNGKSDSSPNYEIYEKAFLNNILSSEEIKLEIMKGNNEACYILAKTYEIINRNPQDEYNSMLLTLIGSKLGNTECTQLVYSYPTKYTSFESTVNNFIQNYIGQLNITFDDAILSAAYSDTLNTSMLGDPNYNNMYNPG